MPESTGFFVLEHTGCAHIAVGPSLDPRLAEGYRNLLAAAGYTGWLVRITAITPGVLAMVGATCEVCVTDPERMRIALEGAACAQDADARLAATVGAATLAAGDELADRGEPS